MVSTIKSAGWPWSVHGRADLADPAGRPGRGLVVDDHHGLDCMHFVLRQLLFDRRGIGAAAPVAGQEIDLDAPAPGHVVPERGEMPGLDHQDPVARRQRVDDCGLPGAGAGRREDHDRPGGLEDAFAALQHGAAERRELGAAVVDDGHVHRTEDAIRDRARPWNLQKMPSLTHDEPPAFARVRSPDERERHPKAEVSLRLFGSKFCIHFGDMQF